MYFAAPFALSGLAVPAVAQEPQQDEGGQSVGSSESVEPVIRKTFPESWIFDVFNEYVFEHRKFDEKIVLRLRFL